MVGQNLTCRESYPRVLNFVAERVFLLRVQVAIEESRYAPHFNHPRSRREAGSLINRPVTFRTIGRFWHPHTGITAFLLLLSATTELGILNLTRNRIHSRIPNLRATATLAFPRPFWINLRR